MISKRIDSAEDWWLEDNKRNPTNPLNKLFYANEANAEVSGTGDDVSKDFLSNGVKIITANANWNASGGTFVYMAWAEMPFKYATAR